MSSYNEFDNEFNENNESESENENMEDINTTISEIS
jgi:hypothetical protein